MRTLAPRTAVLLAATLAITLITPGCAQLLGRLNQSPGHPLFVVNALNQSVTVLEPKSGSVVKTIKLNSLSPHDITYLPKRGKVYVVNTGYQQLSILDSKTQTWMKNILTLPVEVDGHVDVTDGRTCMSCHRDPVGGMPVNLVPSTDEHFLYVANLHARKISVIDTDRDELVDTIPTQEEALGLAIIGDELWVSNRKKKSVSVIDIKSKNTVATLPAGEMPGFVIARPAHGEVYVCVPGDAKVLVFDAKERQLIREIPTSLGTRALAFNEAKGLGYAANYYTDSVTMFELATGKVVKTETFKLNPDDVALSKDGSELYVTCTGTGEFLVLDAVSLKERRRFPAGPYPSDMVLVH
ncbi:Lactonase, 7-bladed beta-propeller [compost metagenome]